MSHSSPLPLRPTGFQARPLHATFGVEVTGLDLARPLAEASLAELRFLIGHAGIVVFRDQDLTPAQQVAFTRNFGEPVGHVLSQFLLPEQPEILVVSNILNEAGNPIGIGDAGQYWHADLTYQETPSLGAFLYARELPETGGDTLFADLIAAYDTLPPAIKTRIDGLKATHRYLDNYRKMQDRNGVRPELTEEQKRQVPGTIHPVVVTHPESGRKSLYVSEGFTSEILGLPAEDGAALLRTLFDHSTQAQFIYRHVWRDGDLVFWDNRSTIHKASGGYAWPQRRLMHRTTLKGERLG